MAKAEDEDEALVGDVGSNPAAAACVAYPPGKAVVILVSEGAADEEKVEPVTEPALEAMGKRSTCVVMITVYELKQPHQRNETCDRDS